MLHERAIKRCAKEARMARPARVSSLPAALPLEQPLFAPKAYFGYGMARKEADAKDLAPYRRKEDAVYRVLAAYLDVGTARRFAGVAGQGMYDPRVAPR